MTNIVSPTKNVMDMNNVKYIELGLVSFEVRQLIGRQSAGVNKETTDFMERLR